jgi:hypothetical protein
MVVPIFSFGDNPIWFKLLIVSICLYFLGRSMQRTLAQDREFRARAGDHRIHFIGARLSFLAYLLLTRRDMNSPTNNPIKAPVGPVTKADVITISRSLSCMLPEKNETRAAPRAAPAAYPANRPNMAKMTLRIFAFLLWPAFDGRL